ncbi:hypothetical protein GON03_10670 [Nocardioides sp. MAH-18]|uniref:DUF2231 domain-containing protein n=1 Tax=Nocardioides agri TaxID=2682843 RepID=A0A6L6XQQ2_9ACTN|nr:MULTISPECIES: DUF2231 domain-containing protein [unclassified Nocardioides]MBA2954789.1 hypothetical protein [Nocardioides sp. CGMCC 1.13656]MVQ49644.1 hypothetical protein [Nocardioides sp. MAH-18]
MFDTVFGLPVHPLIVHATVVVVPLAALLVALSVCWPRFRAWAGPLPACLSLAGLVLTPLSTASGESLEETVGESSLVERHAELGDQLLPLTAALFVLSGLYWWLDRRRPAATALDIPTPATTHPTSAGGTATLSAPRPQVATPSRDTRWRAATSVVGVLAVLAALATGVQVARIGHSGAKAAWSDASALVR